jgi:hypothetical protein
VLSRRELLKFAAVGSLSAFQSRVGFSATVPAHSPSAPIDQSKIGAFRNSFSGDIICPDDSAYDSARIVASFNPTTDCHPQIIARCADEPDIARAIKFARENSLEVAVRAGGFDVLGASTSDGMVIDLSRLKSVVVDEQTNQAGVRSSELISAATSLLKKSFIRKTGAE